MEFLSTGQKEIISHMTELFSKLNARMDQISSQSVQEAAENSVGPSKVQGEYHKDGGNSQNSNISSNPYFPKTMKLDFPRFNGAEDPTSWWCRAEQFFQLHGTSIADYVSLTSFHLEGDAQLWYQLLKQEKERTVKDYQTTFEKLLAKVGTLPQDRQVSCFVSGLHDNIRTDVQANRPTTLTSAISLARLFEARELSLRKPTSTASRINHQSRNTVVAENSHIRGTSSNGSSFAPVRKMTTKELNERRRKGLCFRCNEKFGPGHQCKKLFLIQACLEESDDDVEMDLDGGTEEQPMETPEISLHAMAGTFTTQTMRVRGRLHNAMAIILVDSGSTHNFVSESLAKEVGLQATGSNKFGVLVASGEKLTSSGKCSKVHLKVQGLSLFVDFYLLPLEGYDIVLGTQWLSTLGPIVWDFSKLQMKFNMGNKKVILQGLSTPENRVVSDLQFKHSSQKRNTGAYLQFCSIKEP
ncbi:hypothetical protein LWI28_024310 [Acer negundo]|uniref:Retrotransposon gag domain-containing protein n=1 Tax=Acer negundo TaxID=4023 RepID=A0AAD5NMA0_ACENE|nr:hypothetical protein LWI28_024310 [Acer negundo]